MSFIKLNFWAKETGNLMSHTGGLTREQITELQNLKEGDRIILWRNSREKDSDAHYTLKVYKPSGK